MEIRGLAIPTHTLLGIRDTSAAKVFENMGLEKCNNGSFYRLKYLAWDVLHERIQACIHTSWEDTQALLKIYRKVESRWIDTLSPISAAQMFENSPPQTNGPPSSTAEEWLDTNYWRMAKAISDASSITSFHSAKEDLESQLEEIDLFASLDDFEYNLPPFDSNVHPLYVPTLEEDMPPPPPPDQLKVLSGSRVSVFERLTPKVVETPYEEVVTIKTKRWSHGVLGHHPEKIAKIVSPQHVQSSSLTLIPPSESVICSQQRLATPPRDDQSIPIIKGNENFRSDEDVVRYNRWHRLQKNGPHATPPPLQKVDIDEPYRQTPRNTDLPWYTPPAERRTINPQIIVKQEPIRYVDPFDELSIDLTDDD